MELKKNIRERRLERLKQIRRQNNGLAHPHPRQLLVSEPYRRPEEPEQQAIDARWEDPEYVWKQREAMQWGRLDHSGMSGRSGGSGDDPPAYSRKLIWHKFWISLTLFAFVWGVFQWEHPLGEKGRQWIWGALHEPFHFETLAAWYERTFSGAPSFIPVMRFAKQHDAQSANADITKHFPVPVRGKPLAPFQEGQTGIVLETKLDEPVASIGEGRVVHVMITEQGASVTIRHAQGYESIYGGLRETSFRENDWIYKGEVLGRVKSAPDGEKGKLFFALKRNGHYIDPADVIHFD